MTTNAIVENTKICQANLGVKIHDAKDPAEALGPMFRQVCGTIFSLMERHESFWMPITASDSVPTFGREETVEPDPIQVNQPRMVQEFKEGLRLFGSVYREIFSDEVMNALEDADGARPEEFHFHTEVWVKLLYELAAKYHHLPVHRMKMLTMMTPLYLGRVASFITRTRDMDSQGAEAVVEEQAETFERLKPYLVERWNSSSDPNALDDAFDV
jgi:hypothetical protein